MTFFIQLLNPRRRKLALVLLAVGILAALWLGLREPTYEGRTASDWLNRLDSPTDADCSVSAFKALGRPGVMFLIKKIKEPPLFRGETWMDKLADSHLPIPQFVRRALQDHPRPKDPHAQALQMLRQLGPDAAPALPELMRQFNRMVRVSNTMEDWDVVAALEALGDNKAQYVPDFIKAVQNPSYPTAIDGAMLLGSIGPKANSAIPVLLEQMPTGDWNFSNVVAEAIWKIDRRTNLVLEVFTNGLLTYRDKLLPLRSLAEMGPAARPAVLLVQKLLAAPDEMLRVAAADALSKIDPVFYRSTIDQVNQNPAANIQRLLQLIQTNSSNPKMNVPRLRAFEVLALYGADARGAVPEVINLLQTAPSKWAFPGLLPEEVITLLAEIGPEANAAVPALIALLPPNRTRVNDLYVCRALGDIGPGAVSAVPALKQILQNRDVSRRLGAATALTRIAPEEKWFVGPILMTLTNFTVPLGAGKTTNLGQDPNFSWPAKVALWRLGFEKQPPIQEIMQSKKSWNYFLVLPLLGDIGPAAKPALPKLEQIVDSDPEISYRRMAAIAIRKIDPQEFVRLRLPGILAVP